MEERRRLEQYFADHLDTDKFPLLAEMYLEAGQYQRARKVCEIGLSYHPGQAAGLFILVRTALADGCLEEAEKLLQVLVVLKPGRLNTARLLVQVQQQLRRPEHVLLDGWEHVHVLDPEDPEARAFLTEHGRPLPFRPRPAVSGARPAPAPPAARIPEAEAIPQRMATFTLAAVLKEQGLYHQALEVLDILEKKGDNPTRVHTERAAIRQILQTAAPD